jgi:hypothetical protein
VSHQCPANFKPLVFIVVQKIRSIILIWAWKFMPVIPALRKLRLEDFKFEASLGSIVRS